MNRSHLLPATLLALAAVAIAQSTQNQSNIARLVNVINQVTAKVDGVIPLREHVTMQFETAAYTDDGPIPAWRYEVPVGFRAIVTYVTVQAPFSVILDTGVSSNFFGLASSGSNDSLQRLRGLVLNEGDTVIVGSNSNIPGTHEGLITVALEEI